MERPNELTNTVAISITRDCVEQLSSAAKIYEKVQVRLFLGHGAITSFLCVKVNDEICIPWESDHLFRLRNSLQHIFDKIILPETLDKLKVGLRLALKIFNDQKIDFEKSAFTVLANYIPDLSEVVLIIRKREIESEKEIFLTRFENERWSQFPCQLKIGFYSQEFSKLEFLKKKLPHFSPEVYFASKQNGKSVIDEGSTNNIYLFNGKNFKTPPLRSGVLKGIAREKVIQYFIKNNISYVEEEIELEELIFADSIWLSNAVRGFRKVSRLDEKDLTSVKSVFDGIWKEILIKELLNRYE